ncbi:MAG TPA: hypothetical protein EYP58_02130 [bacterium (Candidatus Stahlbacteria)]|nr:hypothetical protein [Candidatus Stahlbacteria bacterium]
MIRFRLGRFGIKRSELKLFAFNLKGEISTINAGKEVDVGIYDRPIKSELIKKSTVEERLNRGEVLFLAKDNSGEIGYLFATKSRCWVSEVEDWFEVEDSEVYLYDAFTKEEHRGMHIYPFLIYQAVRHFKTQDLSQALIFSTAANRSSIKGIARARFSIYQTVNFLNLCGLRIWKLSTRRCDVRSRFRVEG